MENSAKLYINTEFRGNPRESLMKEVVVEPSAAGSFVGKMVSHFSKSSSNERLFYFQEKTLTLLIGSRRCFVLTAIPS